MITVVNVKHDNRPAITYIGRPMPGRPGSPLGNPYKAGEHDDPIGLYRKWLWQQLQSDTPQRREIERLADLHRAGQELLLGCWCKNPDGTGDCHGDVIKAAIEWMAGPKGPPLLATEVGARVCFVNAMGQRHYGRIVSLSNDGGMVEVDWERPKERNWTYAPGSHERVKGTRFEVVERRSD